MGGLSGFVTEVLNGWFQQSVVFRACVSAKQMPRAQSGTQSSRVPLVSAVCVPRVRTLELLRVRWEVGGGGTEDYIQNTERKEVVAKIAWVGCRKILKGK